MIAFVILVVIVAFLMGVVVGGVIENIVGRRRLAQQEQTPEDA